MDAPYSRRSRRYRFVLRGHPAGGTAGLVHTPFNIRNTGVFSNNGLNYIAVRLVARISVFLAAAFLLPLIPAASQQQPAPSPPQKQNESPTFKTRTVLVNLTATVTDRRHKFVTDLDEKDFHVFDEGKLQEISFFSRQTDLPLRIGVLLDTSNSIRDRLKFEQEAAIDFLYNTLRRDRDLAFVMTFDNEPEVIQDFTDDIDRLSTIIRKQRAGGGTAFRDAIYMGSEKLMNPPAPAGNNPQVRRVLVVISDGDDNLSDRTLSEAMEMAERAEVSIYAISTNTEWLALDNEQAPKKFLKSHGDEILEHFADDTGGRVFFPYRLDDLAQSFLDIGNELRSQYILAYRPADIGSRVQFRRVRVEVDRKGLVVRSRRGYYASPTPPASSPGN